MIRLDLTTKKLQVVLAGSITTSQLEVVSSYSDATATGYTGGNTAIATNDTTDVDIVAAPAASTIRDVDHISVHNKDTVSATVTVKMDVGGTDYILKKAILLTGESLNYAHGTGWQTFDVSGGLKTGLSGGTVASLSVSGLTSGRVVFAGTGGALQDDSDFTFSTDTLTVTKIAAFTLAGTIAGGANQLNNIIIGTTTPLAGSFTTGAFSGTVTFSDTNSKIVPGATNFSLRNNADSADNLAITDAGVVTIRAGLTVTAGNFVAGVAVSVAGITATNSVSTGTSSQWAFGVQNTHATVPRGLGIKYSAAAPNTTDNEFLFCADSSATRAYINSNGGLANFQANDINLSTRVVKNGYRVYTDSELLKYEYFLEDVDFGVWKYNDQTHEDWNHGPTVEGVKAALKKYDLADEENSLIAVFDEKICLEGLHTHDLANIAIASLVASNKRLRERVAALEAR